MGFSTQAEDNFYPQTQVTGSRLSILLSNPGRWFIRYFIKVGAPEQDKDKYHPDETDRHVNIINTELIIYGSTTGNTESVVDTISTNLSKANYKIQ